MRPLDRRLLAHGREASRLVLLAVALELAQVVLLIGQALLLARVVAAVLVHGRGIADLFGPILALGLVLALRAGVGWAAEVVARRTSAAVRSRLRRLLLRRVAALGPDRMTAARGGEVATLALRGLDALDAYFARYLPQLLLAGLLPCAVVLCLVGFDWPSALLVVLTLPLIPVFMALVGDSTEARAGAQWAALRRLAHHFLDVLTGLGTLTVFGRSGAQAETIRRLSAQQCRTGRAALRVAFLSSLVLELLATLSVAIVAVVVSLRVLHGGLGFETALFVLLLVPEAYHPLRQLAAHHHASAEGLAVADQVFGILEAEPVRAGTLPAPDPRTAAITLEAVTVTRPERARPVLCDVSLRIEPGRFTGVVAPTGTGKSTLLGLLAGTVRPDRGSVRVGDVDLDAVRRHGPDGWQRRVGWLPQTPELFTGTVRENIALGAPDAATEAIERAAREAAVDLAPSTRVRERGRNLSAGQRRRVALARALLVRPDLLLLDEPTESADAGTEAAVFDTLRQGPSDRTAVVVTHRPALLRLCHRVVHLDRVPEDVASPQVPV